MRNQAGIIQTNISPQAANQVPPVKKRATPPVVTPEPAPILSDELRGLIAVQAHWQNEIDTRKERRAALLIELESIISRIVDSPAESDKNILRTKRATSREELDLLNEEITECQKRLGAARQAVLDYKIQAAEAVYKTADTEAREKRAILLKAQNTKLHFMNRGGRKGETDESINEVKDLDIAIATAKAEVTIANRKAVITGRELQALREG